jgi:acetolactate synthase I/II/III large subunit
LKYSDHFVGVLKDLGYTHCFYVAGGNIMHLLESASHVFTCVPVVHEVTAGIAAEFFNESDALNGSKAFALVTAGPGLTNIITAMAGAYLESRDLLVVGGQVKSSDLSPEGIRQTGIQEINGMQLTKSITVAQLQIRNPVPDQEIVDVVNRGLSPKKGPVFIEFCLDAQGSPIDTAAFPKAEFGKAIVDSGGLVSEEILQALRKAKRPALLIGGGVSRQKARSLESELENLPIPVMTTWNATDRMDSRAPSYFGRPNTWGQRYANLVMQQSDLLIALGTRLGLQQTGFNWQEFVPNGEVVHVEIDGAELEKPHPNAKYKVRGDANEFIEKLLPEIHRHSSPDWREWIEFANDVKNALPLSETVNHTRAGYINSYDFYLQLSAIVQSGDAVVPSSSGASETVAMQALLQPSNATVITTKGLASMGYGLGGAIGLAFSGPNRVIHIEGDGGFAQNLQELGTVRANNLNIKTFILSNNGYASIRMTQKSYFDGHYVGCDPSTGLGLPDWKKLFDAFSIPVAQLNPDNPFSEDVLTSLQKLGPQAYLVPIDPEQTYYPKITSSVNADGTMISNPLHRMTPDLPEELEKKVLRYIK